MIRVASAIAGKEKGEENDKIVPPRVGALFIGRLALHYGLCAPVPLSAAIVASQNRHFIRCHRPMYHL